MAYVLWTRFLKHNPANPAWPDRDRFVLSAGHGSMLLYALLHLTGYDLRLEDLRQFRQWESKTPSHPEYGHTAGVETTTGPLGQGFATGVGMAIAERWLAAQFNRPGHLLVDDYTYAIVSDGDLMEGVASEAASLAGHLKLGKLIYLYDDNKISIDGSTDLANNDRFGSEGRARWQESLQEYEAAKANFELKKEEYDAIKREQELLDNTIRLAALVNVLKTMKMPTTQSALTTYIREKGNPVVTVLQNESLQQKIDILSNEDVFNNFYIKEKSSTKVFKDIAKSIGASVEDVINKNSIYSILADVVANDMNSSNKDGIGIAASFNKFLAFSEKNDVSLSYGFFGTVDQAGEKSIPTDFLNTDAIRNTGNSLGMFADASKDPIPSVLNLNPETVGTSLPRRAGSPP